MNVPVIYSRLGKRIRHSQMCDNHYYKNAFMFECRVTFKKKYSKSKQIMILIKRIGIIYYFHHPTFPRVRNHIHV